MKKVQLFFVSDGTHTRICEIPQNQVFIEPPSACDKGVIESRILNYLVQDGELKEMELFHFINWCYFWKVKGFQSKSFMLQLAEMPEEAFIWARDNGELMKMAEEFNDFAKG